jgi:NADH-quinone oxidoreductase subunit M
MDSMILTLLTFIPLAGAMIIMFIPREKSAAIKWTAIAVSLIPLALATWLWMNYDPNGVQFPKGAQFLVNVPWIPAIGVNYHMGVDGVSVPLIWLTALLTTISLVYSLSIDLRPKEYFWLFLLLETGMMGTFVSLDFVLFYVFWEVSLVPMYFLIGIWGGERREYAAIKFFLYTLVGSVAMLLAILAMYFNTGHSFDMMAIANAHPFANAASRLIPSLVFWGLFLGFAIKVPLFPFHTWLPDAHVQAPTAGSVILAGVLLKMGTYGFLRVLIPMMPQAFGWYWQVIAVLALISIIYGALCAMAQWDMKKLIAYSSVNHMGYVILGIAVAVYMNTKNQPSSMMALNGAQLQTFAHGLITGALFLLVGVIYDRTHTRDLKKFGGIWARMPVYGTLLVIASFASLGLPGMAGFVAEVHVFLGAFKASPVMTGLALIGVVVNAAYLLWMIQRVLLGTPNVKWEKLPDANWREQVCLIPLVILMILFGVWPMPILNIFNTASRELVRIVAGI